jgi:hypothetical protein
MRQASGVSHPRHPRNPWLLFSTASHHDVDFDLLSRVAAALAGLWQTGLRLSQNQTGDLCGRLLLALLSTPFQRPREQPAVLGAEADRECEAGPAGEPGAAGAGVESA